METQQCEWLKRARSYRAAHAALARGDYDGAESYFELALRTVLQLISIT